MLKCAYLLCSEVLIILHQLITKTHHAIVYFIGYKEYCVGELPFVLFLMSGVMLDTRLSISMDRILNECSH